MLFGRPALLGTESNLDRSRRDRNDQEHEKGQKVTDEPPLLAPRGQTIVRGCKRSICLVPVQVGWRSGSGLSCCRFLWTRKGVVPSSNGREVRSHRSFCHRSSPCPHPTKIAQVGPQALPIPAASRHRFALRGGRRSLLWDNFEAIGEMVADVSDCRCENPIKYRR